MNKLDLDDDEYQSYNLNKTKNSNSRILGNLKNISASNIQISRPKFSISPSKVVNVDDQSVSLPKISKTSSVLRSLDASRGLYFEDRSKMASRFTSMDK